ncbi:MAG: ADP-ribosylglycohydrolase family protein [Planctomycetes bacterium]|jgi:ADP-ribosylglycohydrolase|nr:ADP-ribosylglycohydrolase family protein [Planctomycetota bacterium]
MIPPDVRRKIERFQGALAGIALGDSMGAPFEAWPPGSIRQVVGRVEGPDSRREREYLELRVRRGERRRTVAKSAGMIHPAGLYYHCAQQALIVTECLLLEGDAGGESFAKACVRFLKPSERGKFGLHRKPSPAFRASVNRVAQGESWREAGEEPALGDAAVRALPAGLAFAGDPAGAVRRAAELAWVTDRSAAGVTAAVGAALLVADLAGREAPAPPLEVLDRLVAALAGAESAAREAVGDPPEDEAGDFACTRRLLEAFLPWIRIGPSEEEDREALASLVREARKLGFEVKEPASGFAPQLLAVAAYLCLTEPAGPKGAILRAVNLGRSSTALGALTGGLAGALWGRDAFPADWLAVLWNRPAILRMGELLARPGERNRWEGNLHGMEAELNHRSKEEREAVRKAILGMGEPDPSPSSATDPK